MEFFRLDIISVYLLIIANFVEKIKTRWIFVEFCVIIFFTKTKKRGWLIMPKNKNISALTYPDWSRVGKEPEKAGSLRLLPNGDVARDHHIGDELPDIPESREEKKTHEAEVKAVHDRQYEEGFDVFAHEVESGDLGKGLTFFIGAVVLIAVILGILTAVGVL